jgi:hypothetical protein
MVATLLCFSLYVHSFKDAENCVQGSDIFCFIPFETTCFIQSEVGLSLLRRNCGCESVVVWGRLKNRID